MPTLSDGLIKNLIQGKATRPVNEPTVLNEGEVWHIRLVDVWKITTEFATTRRLTERGSQNRSLTTRANFTENSINWSMTPSLRKMTLKPIIPEINPLLAGLGRHPQLPQTPQSHYQQAPN
ncbi:uncharacterized protein PADG_11091 [Paracoccidioides brasiliensis Pb18]|uniref:Uncharacterized protein n=1 Tax=Paracoccidioides brasiliensis (strain Pb18) TaxID=502780 RepID=A0A0A0HTX2_PARBD|nr:uncharacterized protein PADG_11091 [Paracoccidioides brasiliensis Pb18]KGM92639.1 hypothetical protein PADG_11091 [Paracoccidioides brasiliensis Pb18]